MTRPRAIQRAAVTAAIVSASVLTAPASAHAAELPAACQTALLDTLEKFPVADFTVPDKVHNTMLVEVLNLSEADQAAFTQAACTAWNNWATTNGKAVAGDLDTRYRAAAGPVCNKFARSALATIKKYTPNFPAETRDAEKVVKKIWTASMQKLEAQATNPDCKSAYGAVKTGW
ncbi:hypothetical protein [Streptomyces atroolivaceus]|uniref:hypothetical protein n=1 Tax=Streptomyces atroolivaceus TaxID=66869 RepID=UPI003794C52F